MVCVVWQLAGNSHTHCFKGHVTGNAVCLYNASFLPIISAIAFYFHVLSWFIDT